MDNLIQDCVTSGCTIGFSVGAIAFVVGYGISCLMGFFSTIVKMK